MENLDWRNGGGEDENWMKYDSNTIFYGSGKIGFSGNAYNPMAAMERFQRRDESQNINISQWNPQNGLILDDPGMSSNMGSLESLECLLSTSNSQADNTSVEDDGISMIFSDCKNFTRNLKSVAASNIGIKGGTAKYEPKPSWDFSGKSVPSTGLLSSDEETQTLSRISENDRGRSRLYEEETSKRRRLESSEHQKNRATNFNLMNSSSSNINFQKAASSSVSSPDEPDSEAIAQMKEMIYRAAAFRPVNFGVESVERPKRKNVKISNDPQTVAARQRRERISEKIRVLQRLVPGGSKMDTASMLDEAANYLKFLRSQIKSLEALGHNTHIFNTFPPHSPFLNYPFAIHQPPQFTIQNPNIIPQPHT